jgi:hypothetical protein
VARLLADHREQKQAQIAMAERASATRAAKAAPAAEAFRPALVIAMSMAAAMAHAASVKLLGKGGEGREFLSVPAVPTPAAPMAAVSV